MHVGCGVIAKEEQCIAVMQTHVISNLSKLKFRLWLLIALE